MGNAGGVVAHAQGAQARRVDARAAGRRGMKLATLKNGGRDGALVVVSRDLQWYRAVPRICATLQHALDHWDAIAPQLEEVYALLNAGHGAHGSHASDAGVKPFDERLCHSP